MHPCLPFHLFLTYRANQRYLLFPPSILECQRSPNRLLLTLQFRPRPLLQTCPLNSPRPKFPPCPLYQQSHPSHPLHPSRQRTQPFPPFPPSPLSPHFRPLTQQRQPSPPFPRRRTNLPFQRNPQSLPNLPFQSNRPPPPSQQHPQCLPCLPCQWFLQRQQHQLRPAPSCRCQK